MTQPELEGGPKYNIIHAYARPKSAELLSATGFNNTLSQQRLTSPQTAISRLLWCDVLDAYYVSKNLTDAFGQDPHAIAILAGASTNSFRLLPTIIARLEEPSGPVAFYSSAPAHGLARDPLPTLQLTAFGPRSRSKTQNRYRVFLIVSEAASVPTTSLALSGKYTWTVLLTSIPRPRWVTFRLLAQSLSRVGM